MTDFFTHNTIKIKNKHIVFIVFGALVFAFYGNTLFNGFVLDDRPVIRDNPYVHSLKYLPKVFTGCIWESAIGGCKGKTLHYQPLHTLSYLLTYQISSQPWFFHLVNLLYFFIASSLVFIFIRTLSKNFLLAFFTTLIFIVHPINNEVVAWISTANDILAAIFVVLSLFLFTKFRQTGSRKHFTFALISYFLAMLAKEPTIVVIPLLVFSLDLLFWKEFRLGLRSSGEKKGNNFFPKIGELLRKEIKKYLSFGAVFLFYFLIRNAAIGSFGGLASEVTRLGSFSLTDRIYYFFWLFWQYIKKLFFPYPLVFINELTEQPSLSSLKFFLLIFFFLTFIACLIFAVKTKRKIIAFSLFWIFIYVLPMLVFYNVAGENIFAERYLFVSTIGFSFLVSYFLNYFWKKGRVAKQSVLLFLFVVICFSFWMVYNRNKTWKSDIAFFEANIKQNPNVSKNREYLADVLREQGNIEGAKIQWEEIIKRDPDWKYISHQYNNLGIYYRETGGLEMAQEYFEKAVEHADKIKNYRPHNNLGALFLQREDYLKALLYFCQAFQIAPDAPEPQNNFNYVASKIAFVEKEELYRDITDGADFRESEINKIKFQRKNCADDGCLFYLFPALEENEIMLPFLIMAKASPGEVIKIENPSYNPTVNEIAINLDLKYKDSALVFIFPTCDGIYYKVVINP